MNRALAELSVFPIGLGCMPMSGLRMVGHREQALTTIHAALDAGVDLLDTANVYAPDGHRFGHNEELVAEAVRTYTGNRPIVATKGGITRTPEEVWGRDGSPEALLHAAEASAARLGVASIDLYYLHRADPHRPFSEQIAGLVGVKQRGLAQRIGVSNVSASMLNRALEIAGGPDDGGIVAVQNERSPRYRRDTEVLDVCTELGIAYLPWSPLNGAELFASQAQARGVSAQRLTVAWLMARSPAVIPIPGSTRPETILDSLAAVHMDLSPAETVALDSAPFTEQSLYPDTEPEPPL